MLVLSAASCPEGSLRFSAEAQAAFRAGRSTIYRFFNAHLIAD